VDSVQCGGGGSTGGKRSWCALVFGGVSLSLASQVAVSLVWGVSPLLVGVISSLIGGGESLPPRISASVALTAINQQWLQARITIHD
jgi:hypothetical protein